MIHSTHHLTFIIRSGYLKIKTLIQLSYKVSQTVTSNSNVQDASPSPCILLDRLLVTCKVQPWHQHQYFWVTYNMEKITEQVNHWNRPHYTTLNLGSFICWNFCFASFLPVVWIDILVFIFHLMAGSSPTSTSFGYKSFFINL